jgi:hypothetical protein
LNNLDILVESWSFAKVQNPVESGSNQENNISILKHKGSSAADGVLVSIFYHTFTHRGSKEGQIRLIYEVSHFLLCLAVGYTFADNHKGGLG